MKKHREQLYEGMYILSATLSDESRKKALDKIVHGIEEKQGKVHKLHEQGRRKMAYSIRGKSEGYYFVIYFTLPTNMVNELWQEYHLHEDLIRFLTLQVEEVKESLEFKPLTLR